MLDLLDSLVYTLELIDLEIDSYESFQLPGKDLILNNEKGRIPECESLRFFHLCKKHAVLLVGKRAIATHGFTALATVSTLLIIHAGSRDRLAEGTRWNAVLEQSQLGTEVRTCRGQVVGSRAEKSDHL